MAGKNRFNAGGPFSPPYDLGGKLQQYGFGEPVGNVFYVSSVSGSDVVGGGYTPDAPLATIAYALALCVANNHDHIVLLPGHAETVPTAGFAWGTEGVTIVGVGRGTKRPTLTVGGSTAATITISAANVTVRNIAVTPGVDELVTIFTVTGAQCWLDDVRHVEATAKQTLNFATVTGVDFLMTNSCHHQLTAAAGTQNWISLNGADRARISGNQFFLAFSDVAANNVIQSVTAAPLGIEIDNNIIYMTGFSANLVNAIKLMNGTKSMVHDNYVGSDVSALTTPISLGTGNNYAAQNYVVRTNNKSGILEPVADA